MKAASAAVLVAAVVGCAGDPVRRLAAPAPAGALECSRRVLTELGYSVTGGDPQCACDLRAAGADAAPVVRREDVSLLMDASLSIEELREALGLDERRVDPREFRTVGGLVFSVLGHVPAPGEHFDVEGWRIEVVDMDGNRVDKVLASSVGPGTS